MLSSSDSKNPFLTFFFFNDTATTEIYTLSLHDALPISMVFGVPTMYHRIAREAEIDPAIAAAFRSARLLVSGSAPLRSEEHTSELQSPCNLVCRLLLEKKKKERKILDI